MLLFLIIGGIILRSLAPVLFYILGIAFLAFLIYSAYAGIKEKDYGWKEAISTSIHIIAVLVLMFV